MGFEKIPIQPEEEKKNAENAESENNSAGVKKEELDEITKLLVDSKNEIQEVAEEAKKKLAEQREKTIKKIEELKKGKETQEEKPIKRTSEKEAEDLFEFYKKK